MPHTTDIFCTIGHVHKINRKPTLLFLLLLPIILVIGPGCKTNSVSADLPGDLELLEPPWGSEKTVKVGDTLTIRWSIHDKTKVQSVGIAYSLDGGASIPSTQLIANKSIIYPDTSYQWIVKSKQVSDNFVITIWEYNDRCLSGDCADKPSDRSATLVVEN